MNSITHSPLGKTSTYISNYTRELLFPIPRKIKRDEINIPEILPFSGADVWNAYEISWLNSKGKPIVALGEFVFPCESQNIIESKSFKLYLNSFNNTKFDKEEDVINTLKKDLSEAVGATVSVKLVSMRDMIGKKIEKLNGTCLDGLDIECENFIVDPSLLTTKGTKTVCEVLYSDLLKSNCLVTGQPDWGSVCIQYTGKKIQHESLLKYLVSFRNHNEFHEQCVERIFMDIMRQCQPQHLTVEARYTRRGGLDINPMRTTEKTFSADNIRLARQ